MHGLAHLPDRPALERERGRVDDRLVAVVERVQAVRSVRRERRFRGAEDRDAPAAFVRKRDEAAYERRRSLGRPDRVPGDDRHSTDDPVREERGLVLREEVRLVAAQHEGRQRICTPGGDQVVREAPLAKLLPMAIAPRRQPVGKELRGGREHEQQHRDREHFPEGARQVRRSPRVQAERRAAGFTQRERDRELLVGHDAVHPQRGKRIADDRSGKERGLQEDARMRLGIAEGVEVGAARDEGERDEQRADRAVAETVLEVQHDEQAEKRDGNLPRTALAPRQPARGDEQREPERCDERCRDAVDALGSERADQGVAAVRQHRVEDAEQAGRRHEPGEHERTAPPRLDVRAPHDGTRGAREDGWGVDSLHRGGGAERLLRRNLPHDQQRDAGDEVRPAADAEREQEAGGQPLRARDARDEPQQQGGRHPHREKDDDGDGRVLGELVERQRVG